MRKTAKKKKTLCHTSLNVELDLIHGLVNRQFDLLWKINVITLCWLPDLLFTSITEMLEGPHLMSTFLHGRTARGVCVCV